MILFLFDLETTGIPDIEKKTHLKTNHFYSYQQIKHYDRARMIQIAFILYDTDTKKKLHTFCSYVKPQGFLIPCNPFHKITHSTASKYGLPPHQVFDVLHHVIKQADLLISHSIHFDKNILLSELYRYDRLDEIKTVLSKPTYCTAVDTAKFTRIPLYPEKTKFKYPTLQELYYYLTNQLVDIQYLHDAEFDTYILYQCVKILYDYDRSTFVKRYLAISKELQHKLKL